ncbi:hypothetical protein G6F65_021598 [Rhizopus arrhizus]|nr:hypothetical protein G6F65_021598 [Rhizopus arrhizus]
MQPGRIEVHPAVAVIQEGVVVPAVPQAFDNFDGLMRPGIPLRMRHMLVAAEVAGFGLIGRGDDVPPRPALAQVVQRRELASQMKGFVVCGRGAGNQADVSGKRRQRGQQRDRFQVADQCNAAHGLAVLPVHDGRAVGQEQK